MRVCVSKEEGRGLFNDVCLHSKEWHSMINGYAFLIWDYAKKERKEEKRKKGKGRDIKCTTSCSQYRIPIQC